MGKIIGALAKENIANAEIIANKNIIIKSERKEKIISQNENKLLKKQIEILEESAQTICSKSIGIGDRNIIECLFNRNSCK